MADLQQLAAEAPRLDSPQFSENGDASRLQIDIAGVRRAAAAAGFDADSAIGASWCWYAAGMWPHVPRPRDGRFSLSIVFPTGVLVATGGSYVSAAIQFAKCRSVRMNVDDKSGLGPWYYMLHFLGAGGVLLGTLYWYRDAPDRRFRTLFFPPPDHRGEVLAIAEECERFLGLVEKARQGYTGTPPAQSHVSVADELAKLANLRDKGVITDAEFAAQKARLLGGG